MSTALKAPPDPRATLSRAELLTRARESVRYIERFAYQLVSEAEGAEAVEGARRTMALAVGLRRRLDAHGGQREKESS